MPTDQPPAAYLQAAEKLGRRVLRRREELGFTQEKLAELTGLSRNQIQNIENNRNNTKHPDTGRPGPANARLETVFRLSVALDMSVAELINPDGD